MKFRMNLLASSIVVLGVVTVVAGCGGSSGHGTRHQSYTQVPPRNNLQQDYLYQLVFSDLATGAPISDALQVRFEGPAVDAGLVVDAAGQSVKGKNFTAQGAMAVAASYATDATRFSVVAGNASKGWLQSGVQISQDTSIKGSQTITLKLTNQGNAAAVNQDASLGVAVASTVLPAATGGRVTDVPVSVETPAKTTTSAEGTPEAVGSARITLPAGVSALDDAGNKIVLAGALNLSAVKFSNAEINALSAFPGGFTPAVSAPATVLNGVDPTQGNFISGGFAQFNLTDSTGRALKKFDQPLGLSIDLPKGSLDLNGNVLKAGDIYPVWSYNEQTGQWVFETNGVVEEKAPADPNFYQVNFQSTHLSYWNLDFYGASCTANLTLQRAAGDTRQLSVQITGTTGSRFYREIPFVSDSSLTLYRYPLNQRSTVRVVDAQGSVVGQLPATNLCQGGAIGISAPSPSQQRATLNVQVTESCVNQTNQRPAPTFVGFWNGRRFLSAYARVAQGSPTADASFTNLPLGTSGQLYIWDNNVSNYVVRNVTLNASTVTNGVLTYKVNLPTLSCQIPTGSSGRN